VIAARDAAAALARRRTLWLAGGALAAASLTLAPGGLWPVAARGALVAAALGAAAVLARHRAAHPAAAAPALAVVSRAALAKDTGVALVEIGGRRLLVGFGAAGVQLLSEVPAARPEGSAP
jgi:flagellar protein FliO/FliZ